MSNPTELLNLDALRKIGSLITTQDNRITEAPIFVVEQKTPVISDSDFNDCRVEWRETENGDYQLATPERAERLEALHDGGRDTNGWRRYEVTDIWTFVTACFTEQGCIDYLARNGHNLRETRIYAYGSYRNEEFRTMRNALVSLARRAQPEGEAPQAETVADFPNVFGLPELASLFARAYEQGQPVTLLPGTCHMLFKAMTTAPAAPTATLSPLCGAQHAESGAMDVKDMSQARRLITQLRAALAAQQAAAPGVNAGGRTLDAEATRAIRRAVRYLEENDCTGPAADLKALLDMPFAPSAPGTPEAPVRQPELSVWYGAMPESNGKSNFTAILKRKDAGPFDSCYITIDRSEYPDRVRYEADRVRWLIGELEEEPFILDYDGDKHSGCKRAAQLDGGQEGSAT